MCRLFGMHAGAQPVTASFWLIDAPDSPREQSHHNADGAGIGVFDDAGEPHLDKQPIAAYADDELTRAARTARSRTFVAHVRYSRARICRIATLSCSSAGAPGRPSPRAEAARWRTA